MAGIRVRDTGPEVSLRRAMWALGLRGWRCDRKDLPGRPDIAFSRARLAVFVDGAFWHGHPSKFKKGHSGEFWDRKIAQNQARDQRADTALVERGWTPLRIWDFEVVANPDAAATRVRTRISELSGPPNQG